MSYAAEAARAALEKRIYRQSRRSGLVRSGDVQAPGNRTFGAMQDITDFGIPGFAVTGGDTGGFVTNPEAV